MEDQSIQQRFREARRALGMTQLELADRISAQQAAVSMWESGRRHDALSREKLLMAAQVLGLELAGAELERELVALKRPGGQAFYYCPLDDCDANVPYYRPSAGLCCRPGLVRAPAGVRLFCRHCGEPLIACCPSCRAPVQEGSHCPHCGGSYVTVTFTAPPGEDPEQWTAARRARIREVLAMTAPAELSSAPPVSAEAAPSLPRAQGVPS